MAKTVARLDRKRLIERSIPSIDKRAIQLSLSKSGKQLIAHLLPRMVEHNDWLEETLSKSEKKILKYSLNLLSHHSGR